MPNLREGHGKGEEAVTHFACNVRLEKEGPTTECCDCSPHANCQFTPQGTPVVIHGNKSHTLDLTATCETCQKVDEAWKQDQQTFTKAIEAIEKQKSKDWAEASLIFHKVKWEKESGKGIEIIAQALREARQV